MNLSRIAAAARVALAFALPVGAGFAAEAPADTALGDRDTFLAGPVLGDAEKDSIGFARGPEDDCARIPFFSRDAVPHGPSTGNPEKDSFGLRVVGQYDSCDGGIR